MRATPIMQGTSLDPGPRASLAQLRRAAALTGVVGAAFSLLFLLSLWLLSMAPRPHDSNEEFIDFYTGDGRKKIVLVGLYLLPLAAVAFIWFIAALRQWTAHSRRHGSQLIATVQLLSGVAFITLALASAASSTMPAALVELSDETLKADVARDFPLYGNALLLVFGVRMAAMFVMTTTTITRKVGFMPRWFSLLSFLVAAVLFLSASLSVWLAVVFPLWVLALGILIIINAYRMGPDSQLLVEEEDRIRAQGSSADDAISD